MRRRQFLGVLGGAAAWPVAARGQQAMPVIGFLSASAAITSEKRMIPFRNGLAEMGYVEGQNVSFVVYGAEGDYSRLPTLAGDLVRRHVSVIVSPQSIPTAIAARDATKTIPIIFSVTADPVKLGLVASLARPGNNATGVNTFSTELTAKRLGLLRELVPTAARVAVLINPASASNAETTLREVGDAARAIGLQIQPFNAGTSREIEAVFTALVRERPDALFVGNDTFFSSRNVQLVLLTTRHMIPAIFSQREYPDAGGLMSYGTSLADVYRQMGIYAGRVLKGAKPSELPVVQSTKFEFVINLQSAKALGLSVPIALLGRADEIIE